ncbi:MAG: hypothetical protein JRJ44_03195 [Deltaproteobacteria bacterium]|nr:hypothetical protein [Deltaproteobacteria bacterium]
MSDFENELLKIIEERQSALFEIERVVFTKRYNLSRKHFEIFSIQSIAMIYSIWEGFIQNAFRLYLDELNKKKIEFQKFGDSIVIFHMENTFKQLKLYPQKDNGKISFYLKLKDFFSNKYHPVSSKIDLKNNVNFEVLNKILKAFCLKPFKTHWKDYNHPNPNLKDCMYDFLRYRNSVAHGGDISSYEKVTHKVYKKYKKLVIDLMYEIQNKIAAGIKDETFLKDQ